MTEEITRDDIQQAESLSHCELVDDEGNIAAPFREDYRRRRRFVASLDSNRAWLYFLFRANRPLILSGLSVAALLLIAFFIITGRQQHQSATPIAAIMPAEGDISLRLSSGETLVVNTISLSTSPIEGVTLDDESNTMSYAVSLANKPSYEKSEDTFPAKSYSQADAIAYHALHVPKGRTFTLLLADGTRVWLNSETTLTYPAACSDNHRELFLAGEALFDVVPGSQGSFRVKTDAYTVVVSGTRFNVKAYPDEDFVATTLVSGAVSIPDETGETRTIKPGEQYRFSRPDSAIRIEQVETDLFTSWIDGKLRMQRTPLNDITIQLKRQYNVDFAFETEALKQETFTGIIPLNENLHVILGQLSKVSAVDFFIDNSLVEVTRKTL